MSRNELQRIEVLTEVLSRRRTEASAAAIWGISTRQTRRLVVASHFPSAFSKDQRVSHTAIVENKRLGHVLALINAQQDLHFEAKVKTNSEKDGYQKRGRQVYGPDYIPKIPAKAVAVAEPTAKKA